jgi:membrane peptidoglycan carboxypeptidase
MEMYLNIVYFGRGAYGIEAAAQAYFGKDVGQLTMAESMVLAGVIKNPNGNGKGSPYDPTVNKSTATDRFTNYIKPNMLKLGFMTQAEFNAMQYPTTVIALDANNDAKLRAQWGLSTPQGLIVHHVMDELSKVKNPDGSLKFADASGDIKDGIRNGGLKIITTINAAAENDAIGMASGQGKGSPMAGQPATLQAALVSVEPGTGRVVAYYGGPTGSGADYAAFYNDPVLSDGKDSCCIGHPPGSSFKVYTLTTALINDYSITSYWNGNSPLDFPKSGRTKAGGNQVKNAGDGGGGPGKCIGGAEHCMLWEATAQSLNTPFFAVTEAVGASHVLDTAKAAGIRYMWATVPGQTAPVREDVQTAPSTSFSPKYFQTEIGFGQYPITVLDHANGVASLAARGYAAGVHFVTEVDTDGKKIYSETVAPKRIPGFTDAMADDMDWVLKKIPEEYHITLAGGRESAGKTGTWQYAQTTKNAHAWFVGFTGSDVSKKSTGLATAVWVGNKDKEQPIVNSHGTSVIGGNLPGPIWKAYMDKAMNNDLKENPIKFPPPKYTGTKEEGNATSPQPTQPIFPNGSNNPITTGPGLSPSNGPGNGQGGGGGGGAVPRTSRTKSR